MNARILTRSTPVIARQLLAPRVAAPSVAIARRFASSEAFGPELIKEREHHKEHAGKSADLWRKVSFYICFPGAVVLGIYMYGVESGHIEHRDHEIHENGGELPEQTIYEYNDIRKKPFPWASEGKDNSFFFNAKANRSVDL